MKDKAIPGTGYGGLKGCETLRIPHFLDNRVTNEGKIVSLTSQQCFFPGDFWYSFQLQAESIPES
jgi:hypothetical protein